MLGEKRYCRIWRRFGESAHLQSSLAEGVVEMDVASCIGMGNATIESAAPYSNSRKGRGGNSAGCQIDLLVQTPKTAYVVEVKRKNYIDTEIEAEVGMKIKRLPMRLGMTVRPVLVYAGELSKSVEADGYFDAIIPARRLLGL